MILGWIILPDMLNYLINPQWRPSTNILDYWELLTIIGSFAVYIILYSFERRDHTISDSYSRVIYFYVILYVAYLFIRGAIFPKDLINSIIINNWDRYLSLAAYATVATTIILRSWKTGLDIQKPT